MLLSNLLDFVPEVPVDPEVDKAVEETAANGEPQSNEFQPVGDSFLGDCWEKRDRQTDRSKFLQGVCILSGHLGSFLLSEVSSRLHHLYQADAFKAPEWYNNQNSQEMCHFRIMGLIAYLEDGSPSGSCMF